MPKALFVHDTWYATSPEGHVYSYGAFPYYLWQERFLPHFDSLHVIGRKAAFTQAARDLDRSDGDRVTFTLLPNINAPVKRIIQSRAMYRRIAAEVDRVDAVIVRGPAEYGMMAAKAARRQGKSVAVEMSGCAFDHTWYHGSLIARLYAPVKYLRCRNMVKRADQVIYVTQNFLQRRYPTKGLSEAASNVEIATPDEEVLEKRLKRLEQGEGRLVLGMIGNIGNRLKGFEVALKALGRARDTLPPFELRVLGQAPTAYWQDMITRYGLDGYIAFDGTTPGGRVVLDWLDIIDIYIQPSFHEGLPRALIESMSRALPALASNAGGTAELLDEQFMHKRGDAGTLAQQLITLANDTALQSKAAQTNFRTAQYYTRDVLQPRRNAFWVRFSALVAGNGYHDS